MVASAPRPASGPCARKIGSCGVAADVERDRAAVHRRAERRIVLGFPLDEPAAVGAVAVRRADQDVDPVFLDQLVGRGRLAHGADVLGDEVPVTSQRRVEVDDLVDGEREAPGEHLAVGGELAGVVGQLAGQDVVGVGGDTAGAAVVAPVVVVPCGGPGAAVVVVGCGGGGLGLRRRRRPRRSARRRPGAPLPAAPCSVLFFMSCPSSHVRQFARRGPVRSGTPP